MYKNIFDLISVPVRCYFLLGLPCTKSAKVQERKGPPENQIFVQNFTQFFEKKDFSSDQKELKSLFARTLRIAARFVSILCVLLP